MTRGALPRPAAPFPAAPSLAGLLVAALLLAGCGDDTPAASGGDTTTTTTVAVAAPTTEAGPSTTVLAPPTSAAAPRPLPGGGLGVVVVGDSVMFDAEAAISAALEATGAVTATNASVFGLGFSDEAAIPFAEGADELLGRAPTQQAVVMVGSWDHLAVQRDPDAYAEAVAAGLARLADGGRRVLVLGEPPSEPAKGEEAVRAALDAILEQAVARQPGARYLDSGPIIGNARGAYVRSGPDGLLRKPDGRHLCPAGAARFGDAVLEALRQDWALPPADDAWRSGGWRADPRYDDPAGACAEG